MILDDYVREIRPIVAPPRTFQRTVYRRGQNRQFDLWEPSEKVPVGAVEHRRGWVVVACLGYSRAGAGALVFSKETPDLLWGDRALPLAYLETNFEPGRKFVNERDYQGQVYGWFIKANQRTHRTLHCRPVDRLTCDREAMQPLPAFPDLIAAVTRVPRRSLPAL